MAGVTVTVAADSKKESTSTVSAADAQFVRKAAAGGMAEVDLGKLAQDKASNKDIKQFGEHMVRDRFKINDEMKDLASSKNVTIPDSLDAKEKALYDRLSKLSGDQFDKAYMNAMLKDHEADVPEFRKECQAAKDSDVRVFAAKHLPTLEDHLRMSHESGSKIAD
jgi:putative membrane protein